MNAPEAPRSAAGDGLAADLYEVRRTIHPRSVHGWFANWRIALVLLTQLVFYGLPWLNWNGRQAVLFELAARKFYIFGLVLWPQDFIYLTALLIISALTLFLFTAVAGRLWCGYACPQTVYTEIFLWIERVIEGDRMQRMRLDRAPWNLSKWGKKAGKHALWIALSLWTGFTFVGYFSPLHDLLSAVHGLHFGPWESFWILFYGFTTYGNAGWMREQVCLYMCPYARFQSVMFDPDTLVITYDAQRGEPRGARSRSADRKTLEIGDCVDCGICVQACPTGIDIRRGLQYECIGCAACIDGCDQVMDKLGYARGLIRYSTENAVRGRVDERSIVRRVWRPRTLVYGALLFAICAAFVTALTMRVPLKLDVIRDRATLMRETSDGLIENVYQLQIMNTGEEPRSLLLTVSGIPGLRLMTPQPIAVAPASSLSVPVELRIDPASVTPGSHAVRFELVDSAHANVRTTAKTMFYVR